LYWGMGKKLLWIGFGQTAGAARERFGGVDLGGGAALGAAGGALVAASAPLVV